MQPELETFERLPIFRVRAAPPDPSALHELATHAFGIEGYASQERDDTTTLRSGDLRIEIHDESGGLYVADEAPRWNPALTTRLPDERETRAIADALVARHKLLPELRAPFSIGVASLGGTRVARFDRKAKRRTDRSLDVQVNYAVRIALEAPRGNALTVPVIGGGGDITVTIGDAGRVIGFDGVWRPVISGPNDLLAPIVPRAEADERFQELTKGMRVREYESYLAYYAAPASSRQEFLYPVSVYRATGEIGKQRIPLRLITLPATRFGPPLAELPRQPKRSKKTRPDAAAKRHVRRGLASLSPFARALSPFEAGASWIGQSGGLAGSQQNAQGFVDGLAADGWRIHFNWGDANAWESDWHRNDDDWMDAADSSSTRDTRTRTAGC